MIFIDCGFYDGIALKKYMDKGLVDEHTTIYAFEANPDFAFKESAAKYPVKIKKIKKAVWIRNGKVPFMTSGYDSAAHIKGTTSTAEDKRFNVPAINFSKFVEDLPDEPIICSMDIEGAEFAVLEKMIDDDTIDKIDLLDIEFHHRFMGHKTSEDAEELVSKLIERTAIRLKIPLR